MRQLYLYQAEGENLNYIVFDLEWNQSASGKKNANKKLTFEII
jgi:hypothetical protein